MFDKWSQNQAELPPMDWLEKVDFVVRADKREMVRVNNKIDIRSVKLSDQEISNLVAFMTSLTGENAYDLPLGMPKIVPSGLEIDDE